MAMPLRWLLWQHAVQGAGAALAQFNQARACRQRWGKHAFLAASLKAHLCFVWPGCSLREFAAAVLANHVVMAMRTCLVVGVHLACTYFRGSRGPDSGSGFVTWGGFCPEGSSDHRCHKLQVPARLSLAV